MNQDSNISLISVVRLHIEKPKNESKKDINACIVICVIITLISIFLEFISGEINLSFISNIISTKMQNITELDPLQIVGAGEVKKIVFIILFPFVFLPIMIFLIKVGFKRERIINIVSLLFVGFSFTFFKVSRFVLSFTGIILGIAIWFHPIGSGYYYRIIRNLDYLNDMYSIKKFSKKDAIKKVVIFLFLGVIFIFVLKIGFPQLTVRILVVSYFATVLLFWFGASHNAINNILKKIFVYTFFVPFILINNNLYEVTMQNAVLVLISVFFSMDRVIGLIKELNKKIENESLRYLLDKENDKGELLSHKIVLLDNEIKFLSDENLLRQIVIRYKLESPNTQELIIEYRKRGIKKQKMLIDSIEYFMYNKNLSLIEREEKLNMICQKRKGDIYYLPIREEYAKTLFFLKRGYNKIVELLLEDWLFINNESRFILYVALKREGKETQEIKNEIENFDEFEKKYKKYCE